MTCEGSGVPPCCEGCGGPIVGASIWYLGFAYHVECAGRAGTAYKRMPATPGCAPVNQLTENDVRRIVREELAANA